MSMSRRQKVKDLIKLALDGDNNDNERMAAALRAVKIIDKYDLLSSPLDGLLASDNETVQAATDIFSRITDPILVRSVKKIADQVGRARQRRRSR